MIDEMITDLTALVGVKAACAVVWRSRAHPLPPAPQVTGPDLTGTGAEAATVGAVGAGAGPKSRS